MCGGDMSGGDMSPYSVSGAKPQPPNVVLDIIGAYMSAEWWKAAVIFSVIRPKSGGYGTPTPKNGGPTPTVNYAYDWNLRYADDWNQQLPSRRNPQKSTNLDQLKPLYDSPLRIASDKFKDLQFFKQVRLSCVLWQSDSLIRDVQLGLIMMFWVGTLRTCSFVPKNLSS